jgi:phosphatidate cytidylyltransferase
MFADAFMLDAGVRLGAALATALAAIVVAERHHLAEMKHRALFLRWRTWAISAPVFAVAATGPLWLGLLFVSALSWQGMREYSRLVGLPRGYRLALYLVGLASVPIAVVSLTLWRGMPPILLLAATLLPLVSRDLRAGVRNLAYAAFGFAYVPWLLTYMLLIRLHIDGGDRILIALGMAVALSDVCAFTIGKMLGRHRFAARLSPSKTVEGVAGNVIGAYLGFGLMSFAVAPTLGLGPRIVLPLIVAIACVWGDLVESLIKRVAGVKDAGSWLPGFGGLLDRIDSLLFVLPLSYTALTLWA